MTVQAIARAPSRTAWSAEGVAQAAANAAWWLTAPWASMPIMGWMDGTTLGDVAHVRGDRHRRVVLKVRPSASAWRR